MVNSNLDTLDTLWLAERRAVADPIRHGRDDTDTDTGQERKYEAGRLV